MTLRLLLADDHEVVRAGVRAWLAHTEIEIVQEASSAGEVYRSAPNCQWDLALIDLDLPDDNGFVVAQRLRETHPVSPVILYADHDFPRFSTRAAAIGAAGLLQKSASREALLSTLRSAASVKPVRPRKLPAQWEEIGEKPSIATCLTDRELEVLKQLATGSTNKQIAVTLGISYETVKEHVQHVLQKLGVADRTQAAVWAVRKGLI